MCGILKWSCYIFGIIKEVVLLRMWYNQRSSIVTYDIIKEVILLHTRYNLRSGLVTYMV